MNTEQTITTLNKILEILSRHNIEYRILGSVAFAGMYGKVHRTIGDIDLLVDGAKKDILFEEFSRLGYKRAGGMFAFARKYLALETLEHDTLLSVGYFHGTFHEDGFQMGNKLLRVTVESVAIQSTDYSLHDIQFVGIPPRSVAVGVMKSGNNPKRKLEVEFINKHNIKPFKSDGVHVYILGISFDWLYKGTMKFLNILGVIRTKLGFAYDPWRSNNQ